MVASEFERWREAERARRSVHVDFGSEWTEEDRTRRHRLGWIPNTGELYSVDPEHQVEVWAAIRTEEQVDSALRGWSDQMGRPGSLYWARAAVGRAVAVAGQDELGARRELRSVRDARLRHPSTSGAESLDRRERDLAAWERRLDDRERLLDATGARVDHNAGAQTLWSAPAQPVREVIGDLARGTGDTLETVAKGLGLDPEWVEKVMAGTVDEVGIPNVQRICEGLHCSPFDLWGADNARAIMHAYGPELWPRFIEPLQPRDIDLGPEPPDDGPDLAP